MVAACVIALGVAPGCSQLSTASGISPEPNTLLGRGISFGRGVDATASSGLDGIVPEWLPEAVDMKGFQTIRIPVRWSAHAEVQPPYTIDPAFLSSVDRVVRWAQDAGLNVVLDMHDYTEMYADPASETPRFLALWRQLAEHYANAPKTLAFELLNEPNGALDAQTWNDLISRTVSAIRRSDPTRWIVVGPVDWNSYQALGSLQLPADTHLIVTVHYYDPFSFTHQGAWWVSPPIPVGETWVAKRAALALGWQDWSWDTSTSMSTLGATVSYEKGSAGFSLHADAAVSGYDRIQFRTSRAVELRVLCGPSDATAVTVKSEAAALTEVSLSACGAQPSTSGSGYSVPRVVLQNASASSIDPFVLSRLELVGGGHTLALLTTERGRISTAFDQVGAWATSHGNVPVFVGEFGTYQDADPTSRVAWTEAVRKAAEAHRFSWAYWDFDTGFGVYDSQTGAWHADLLHALTGF